MKLVTTSRPIRHIVASKLLCPNVNIVVNEHAIVVRMLFARNRIPKNATIVEYNQLFGFDKLTECFVNIDNTNYIIRAEGRFDLNDPDDRMLWQPGANIIAEYDYTTLQQGIVRFNDKLAYTHNTLENGAEYGKRMGTSTPIQLFCRSRHDTLIECCKSVVSDSDGLLITNIDLSTAYEITPQFVNTVRYASKPLGLQYSITGPTKVPANSVVYYDVEVREEMKDRLCEIYDNNLYVSSSGGYIPVRVVDIVKGKGRFKLATLFSQPGDIVRLKLGTKHYQNFCELSINVV